MLERLQSLEDRYNTLNEWLSDPDIASDPNKLRDYSKEQSDLEDTVVVYRQYKQTKKELDEAQEMLKEDLDEEMAEMTRLEVDDLKEKIQSYEEKLKVILLSNNHNVERNIIIDIRAAVDD